MKVSLLSYTTQPEMVVAAAAKLCYSKVGIDELLNGLTPEKSKEFVKMLSDIGHESPTEHANFTFAVEGVSRALLAQITRHRIASYSVQSQRYVRLDDFDYVLPPNVLEDADACQAFKHAMDIDAENYIRIAQLLKEGHTARLIKQGISEDIAVKKAEKLAIEDARFVLPNACTTKMIITMNARSLNNFFKMRCCNRAQWEIQMLAKEMLRLVYNVAPSLFAHSGPPCLNGTCPEGKMSCGQMAQIRAEYTKVKEDK